MEPRTFITITDFSQEELSHILDRADTLRDCWHANNMPQFLKDQQVGLWFYGSGFRNRIAFEIGARAMGANVAYIPGELGIHEPLVDIGHYLRNWFTLLVIRAQDHDNLITLAKDAAVPVINARTSYNHPCEIIGDLQYIRRKRGSLEGLEVVFAGEVTNLCMSWFHAARRFPIHVIQAGPGEFLLEGEKVRQLNNNIPGKISTTEDLPGAVSKNTDVIYTDCWPKTGEKAKIKELFLPYQITTEILDKMKADGFFLPCPPVSRGEEVSVEAMLSDKCQNYQAKECLLHAQNAIMEFLIA